MPPIPVIVHGLGNIGAHVIQSIETAPDMKCLGVIRSEKSLGSKSRELRGLPEFSSLDALAKAGGKPEVAIICGPSRLVPEDAIGYLAAGLHTADSFDIHTEIPALVEKLGAAAAKAGRSAVTAAGWDPGTDSVVRALLEAMAPKGLSYTNFGPGMSMGHTVAAKSVPGVANALSMTIPAGSGVHRRMVYVQLENGAKLEAVAAAVKADPYFAHDETHVVAVDDVGALLNMGHGVVLERYGVSGQAHNQTFSYSMKINNPALTGQILVCAARAAMRCLPGCYTLIELPVIDLLPGEREDLVKRLV